MPSAIRPPPHSLFVIRFWQEELVPQTPEWRGEIKNVITGEVRYFSNRERLITLMLLMLEPDRAHPPKME